MHAFERNVIVQPPAMVLGLTIQRVWFQSVRMVHSNLKALVLCGPSGSGKSTLLRRLFDDFPEKFGFSVSHTTRSPRPGEVNGLHYHFTTRGEMEAAIENSEFLESAVYSNNTYGTR